MNEEMAIKCELLKQMVAEFDRLTADFRMSAFEANDEALNLMKLATRHVSGVVSIARAGYLLLPAAEVAARAAYEASVRVAWMLSPEDPFDREARWATHLLGEITYLEKEIQEGEVMGIDTSSTQQRRDGLLEFCDAVSRLLVQRGHPPKRGLPPIPDMLKEIGERKTYPIYSLLCQTAHGGHYSTWIFRSGGVGTNKIRGDFVTDQKWGIPLAIARFAFKGPAMIVLKRLGIGASGLQKLVGS
jgi:hypothetical protein